MSPVVPRDPDFEDRVRSHVRHRMDYLGWGCTDLSNAADGAPSQSYLSRWLGGDRGTAGISAAFFFRVCRALELDPLRVIKDETIDRHFWGKWVPQHRATGQPGSQPQASTATAHPPRRTREGGAH